MKIKEMTREQIRAAFIMAFDIPGVVLAGPGWSHTSSKTYADEAAAVMRHHTQAQGEPLGGLGAWGLS